MAWIVKNSAGTRIERRPEPYLTEEIKRKYEAELIPRYATRKAALLPICTDIQHHEGYLPAQALEEVAAFLNISSAEVYDCVTFYEEYHLKPTGKYFIQICRSIGCELCGCKELSKKVQQKLNILPGETTDDGQFTLMELECLGACDLAPCALIDHKLKGPLTWDKLEKEIDALQ